MEKTGIPPMQTKDQSGYNGSVSSSISNAVRRFGEGSLAESDNSVAQRAVMANGDTPASSFRILLVDDYEPWRQQVRSMLQEDPEVLVVAEAEDGLEAVQKAKELKPDLILLDIGLPNLDGLEAANRIRQVAPDAAIIFLTQNSDKDVVRAALSAGARGYVLKSDAGRELHTAVAGILGGDDFVSSGIKMGNSGETEDT